MLARHHQVAPGQILSQAAGRDAHRVHLGRAVKLRPADRPRAAPGDGQVSAIGAQHLVSGREPLDGNPPFRSVDKGSGCETDKRVICKPDPPETEIADYLVGGQAPVTYPGINYMGAGKRLVIDGNATVLVDPAARNEP